MFSEGFMDILIFAFEIIGTVAFSVSGAMTGLKKNMDIFGVMILGVVTAIGGGVTRDLILGITPPGTFGHPVYAIVATVTAIITFLPKIRRLLTSNQHVHDFVLLILDSLGLGVFTVVGIQTAYSVSTGRGAFLVVFVGVITGVGGGVLRDVLAGEKPYIFVKHIYACASIAGAVACVIIWRFNSTAAVVAGAAIVFVIRLLAAHFRWSLPKADRFGPVQPQELSENDENTQEI